MAQSHQGLYLVCRSCRSSLSKEVLQYSQTRSFASTAARSRSIPTFTETSSEDLNAILFEFRDKVFKPAALSKTHQALIYKKSRHHILRNDPGVTVTMSNDEDIKLEPMDRWNRPNKHRSLYKLARILGEESDMSTWENLPRFLEGMVMAKERVPIQFLERITRKANEVGRAGLIRRCAEMAKRTGVRLSMPEVTRELFLGIHTRAAEAQFQGEGLQAAANEAHLLAMLMEKEEHCGGKIKHSGEADMRRDPVVMAVLLEVGAAQALHVHGGQDIDATVASLTQRLLAITKNGADLLQREAKITAAQAVEDWIPIANSLRLTLKIPESTQTQKGGDPNVRTTLQELLNKVDGAISEEIKVVREDAQGKPRRALQMLELVLSPSSLSS